MGTGAARPGTPRRGTRRVPADSAGGGGGLATSLWRPLELPHRHQPRLLPPGLNPPPADPRPTHHPLYATLHPGAQPLTTRRVLASCATQRHAGFLAPLPWSPACGGRRACDIAPCTGATRPPLARHRQLCAKRLHACNAGASASGVHACAASRRAAVTEGLERGPRRPSATTRPAARGCAGAGPIAVVITQCHRPYGAASHSSNHAGAPRGQRDAKRERSDRRHGACQRSSSSVHWNHTIAIIYRLEY